MNCTRPITDFNYGLMFFLFSRSNSMLWNRMCCNVANWRETAKLCSRSSASALGWCMRIYLHYGNNMRNPWMKMRQLYPFFKTSNCYAQGANKDIQPERFAKKNPLESVKACLKNRNLKKEQDVECLIYLLLSHCRWIALVWSYRLSWPSLLGLAIACRLDEGLIRFKNEKIGFRINLNFIKLNNFLKTELRSFKIFYKIANQY